MGLFKKGNKKPVERKFESLVSESCLNIVVMLRSDNFEIVSGDSFKVVTNNPEVQVVASAEMITVTDDKEVDDSVLTPRTTIYVPNDKKLSFVNVKVLTGNVSIGNIMVKELKCEVDTGSLSLNGASVTEKGTYNVLTGNIDINDGSYYNTTITLVTGNVSANTKLCGDTDIKVNAGNVSYKSRKDLKSYTVDLSCASGRVGYDGLKGDRIKMGKGKETLTVSVVQGGITVNYFE